MTAAGCEGVVVELGASGSSMWGVVDCKQQAYRAAGFFAGGGFPQLNLFHGRVCVLTVVRAGRLLLLAVTVYIAR